MKTSNASTAPAIRRPCAFIVLLLLTFSAQAQVPESSKSPSVEKRSLAVVMHDGVKLGTDVYLPQTNGAFPVLLLRTPYNKGIATGIGEDGARHGYATVIQDTRGRFASEGANLAFDADVEDGYDTVEWLMRQPWCNGKLGTSGGSAGAITQLLLASSDNTNVISQHLTVGGPSLYFDVVYSGGVFRKSLIEDWLRATKFSPDALKLWTSHPSYDDYWRARDLKEHYSKVNAAAVHIGGYFDIFAQGTIDAFVGYQEHGGPGARGKQKLIMGPWTHGVFSEKAGELNFPNAKRPPNNVRDQWRWFDHTLKGVDNGIDGEPAVTYYVMGDTSTTNAPGNTWRTASQWPPVPTVTTPYYLHADRTVSKDQPAVWEPLALTTTSARQKAAEPALALVYNPTNPVPTVGGRQLTLPAGPKDQRPIEGRPDVLIFTSESLTAPLEVTGRVRAKLWASSDAPDTDFFVRLCDVYPDGRSFNICEGCLRARFRDFFSEVKLLHAGQVYEFTLDLFSTSIIFNQGHRLRVHVTSSSTNGYDPNPNTGEPFRSSNRARPARNTIYCDTRYPSQLLLPIAAGQHQ